MFINPQADSKAYVSGTNLFRQQETNPLSAQYVVELLVSTAAYANNTTTYYPSAVGMAMAGYKDWSLDFYMTGAANVCTVTVEATDDDVTPYWHDISPSGYERVTNAVGVASYANVAGAAVQGIWDFDELNSKLVRVKIVSDAGGAVSTVRLYVRRKAL